MSNIMKQLRDLHEYLDDFMLHNNLYLTVCAYHNFLTVGLMSSKTGNRVVDIFVEYSENLEVNEIGDMMIKAYSDRCDRNCDWCSYRVYKGCELIEEGCSYTLRHTKLTKCKYCRSFAEVTPNSYQSSIRVCIKGHNGYETFGCTEGEPRNDTTDK